MAILGQAINDIIIFISKNHELVSCIANCIMAILAIIAGVIALFSYIHQKASIKKEKAYEIAKLYANNLLPRLRFTKYLFEMLPNNENVLEKFINIKYFDEAELKTKMTISDGDEKNNFRKMINSITHEQIKIAAAKACIDIEHSLFYNLYDTEYNVNKYLKPEDKDSFYVSLIDRYIYDTLNELEAISILLHYNIADEKIIYQSMHQTVLDHIRRLYYYISKSSLNDHNKYYCNIVWLYNKWNNRHTKKRYVFVGKKL